MTQPVRFHTIDILRTGAIFLMVIVHFSENLSGYIWTFAGMGAPVFAFLSGVSYCLWLLKQQRAGKSEEQISKTTIRRGLFLIALGFAFNVFVWLPEDVFNWDVLTLIGVALLLLNVARGVPSAVTILVCVIVFLLSPILRTLADYPAYWQNGYYDYDPTPTDVFTGFFSNGYFPIFPWILFPLAGFVSGSWVFSKSSPALPSVAPLAWIGGGLVTVSVVLMALRGYATEPLTNYFTFGWTMFPPSGEYITRTLGLTMLLFAAGQQWLDRQPQRSAWFARWSFFETFSKHSLSIYLLHHVVHLWPLWIYGIATGNEPTYFWRIAMPVSLSLPLSLLCMLGCYVLFLGLDRWKIPGVEGWMRWLCDD